MHACLCINVKLEKMYFKCPSNVKSIFLCLDALPIILHASFSQKKIIKICINPNTLQQQQQKTIIILPFALS